MDPCINIVENTEYLRANGYKRKYLEQIHHFDRQTFDELIKYFEKECDFRKENNINLANRIQYIVEGHKKGKPFFTLTLQSLEKWPLNPKE